jgi:DNA-binding NarL/FixJ family response regulator
MNSNPIRVLVVEDNSKVREAIRAFLNEYGGISVVGDAATGREAIELANQLKPDVVLIELLMPDMDGVEVIHKIKPPGPTSASSS